jgi:hypothetical protein
MASLRPVQRPRCCKCSRWATVELVNRVNASTGYYCTPCSGRALRELEAAERQPSLIDEPKEST